MTTETIEIPRIGQDPSEFTPRPVRRLRGLRTPVLPSGTWLAQVGGGLLVVAGTYLQFGLAVTLIVSGAACALLGALREAGKI
jgi:hypothetical protein